MGAISWLREGPVIGVGPLELHVSRTTLGSEEVPKDDLRIHKGQILEEILRGATGEQGRLKIRYQTVKVPFYTEEQRKRIRETPANIVANLLADDATRCVHNATMNDLYKHKTAEYLTISDGTLTLFLGEHVVGVEEGTSGFRNRKHPLMSFDNPVFSIGGVEMYPPYIGESSTITSPAEDILIGVYRGQTRIIHTGKIINDPGEEGPPGFPLLYPSLGIFENGKLTVKRVDKNLFEVRSWKYN